MVTKASVSQKYDLLGVTVAFHDPADRKPIRSAARAQGYAFQEIFWLTDP